VEEKDDNPLEVTSGVAFIFFPLPVAQNQSAFAQQKTANREVVTTKDAPHPIGPYCLGSA
jgi:hypothetical protein